MKLLFATNNAHKVKEIKAALGPRFDILQLSDFNIYEEIPEDHDTLEDNALDKARYIRNIKDIDVIADDTGLEINALGMRPGVFSARYAGPGCSFDDNMNKVLAELGESVDRTARFRTIIALILGGKEYLFEGVVNGKIITEKRGSAGFGYDPIFVPDGYIQTFAEMDLDQKNLISHRAMATSKLAGFLQKKDMQ